MTVFELDGAWWAEAPGMTFGPFETNADAWRWVDRRMGEPVSKREDTAEWIARKALDTP